MPDPIVKIGGTTVEAVPGTLNVSASLGNRATLDVVVQSANASFRPTCGQDIELFEGTSKLWAGSVDEVNEMSLTEAAPTFRRYALRGVTWEQYFERRYCWDVANGRPARYSRNFQFTADPGTDTLTTDVAHGRSNGDRVRVKAHANGALCDGLSANIEYYVISATTYTLQLSMTAGGSPVNITDAGTLEQILITNRAGEVVSGLLVDAATSEPLGDTNVELGAVVDTIIWSPEVSVAAAIQQLAEGSGFVWWVDEERELYFQPRTFTTAPFAIDETSGNYRNFAVRRTREDKVNAALMRVDMDQIGYEEDSFVGDGIATTFTLTYPVGQMVSIKVNDEEREFAIWLAESERSWYYEEGDTTIRQDADDTVLTASDTLVVTYRKFGANTIYVDDSADIIATGTAEGNSGIYQGVFDRPGVGQVQAAAEGEAIIAERKNIVVEIEYETDQQVEPTSHSLKIGQLQTIENSYFNLASGTYLIRELSITDVGGQWLRHVVKAIDATRYIGTVEYWKAMAAGGRNVSGGTGNTGVSGGVTPSASNGWDERPTGAMNGTNKTFVLAVAPSPSSNLILALNGLILQPGVDYSVFGNTITLVNAPTSSDWLRAWYDWNFLYNGETPTETDAINGIHQFVDSPLADTLILAVNGVVNLSGTDYTLSGPDADFATPPDTAEDWLVGWYTTFASAGYSYNETPTGVIDGVNDDFTLAVAPLGLFVVVNGIVQSRGQTFSLSGATITFTTPPASGDWIRVWSKA